MNAREGWGMKAIGLLMNCFIDFLFCFVSFLNVTNFRGEPLENGNSVIEIMN